MKVIHSAILLASALTLTFLPGCSGGSSEISESKPERIDPKSVSFEWQEPYRKILEEFRASADYSDNRDKGSAFDILDIDGDHIPELIISPDTNNSTVCRIYTLRNGSAVELGEICKGGTMVWLPEMNLFRDEYYGDGFMIGSYYSLEDGNFVEFLNYSMTTKVTSPGMVAEPTINGVEYLVPDFEEEMKPYKTAYTVERGRKYTFDEKTIELAVDKSESWGAVLTSAEKEKFRSKLLEHLEGTETNGSDPAFEICDLSGDDIPELIISQGSSESSLCQIYSLSNSEKLTVTDPIGSSGYIYFDADTYLIYYPAEGSGLTCTTLITGDDAPDISTDNIHSKAVLGRQYALNVKNIDLALS